MKRVSRRSFVAGMAVMPFGVWLQKYGLPRPIRVMVRYDARSTEGKAMLKSYADAVNKMQNSTAEGDPRSWVFQWYTHWVRGDRSMSSEMSRIYPSPNPWKTLAQGMWETCQSHGGENENFFLPWHRMFVYYFEHIVREASGNPDFTLPYWNYSTSDAATHGVMPPEFREQSDPTFKWLFVSKRNSGVNLGHPIDQSAPGDLNLDCLKQGSYEPHGAASGFCSDLDGGLHGNVHVLTGNGQNMGSIPWAADDPIFWMHHCNIDRLWASWNKNGGLNPTGDSAWMNQEFTFANTGGSAVVAKIKNVLDISDQLHYTYDHFEPPPFRFIPIHLPLLEVKPTPLEIHALGEVNLGPTPARLQMTPHQLAPRPQDIKKEFSFKEHVAKLPPDKRIFLVIRNLRAQTQPGVLYRVYLDLPANASPRDTEAHRAGTINFFDAVAHHERQQATRGTPKFFSMDVTELAKRLHLGSLLQDKPTVTIAPIGEPAADAKPVIGEISLVEQPAQ